MINGRALVFGVPRSGTSFLMQCLAAQPEAECVSGNLFPVGIVHLASQPPLDGLEAILARSLRRSLGDYLESGVFNARLPALHKWWISSGHVRDLPHAARGLRREQILVYKEPFFSFAPGFVFDAVPDCRVIYIFRDGRDVADSLVRSYDVLTDEKLTDLETNEAPIGRRWNGGYVPWWVEPGDEESFMGATPYVRAIWMWKEMVGRCRGFLNRPEVQASGRVLCVRYEDLIGDPFGQGEAIFAHLGMRVTRRARKRLEQAHGQSIGIHRRRQEPDTIRSAEEVAARELTALGYELGAS